MMKKLKMSGWAGVLALGLIGPASAELFDRGNGMIYDDVLDITWLQDANYAKTSGYHADGMMKWYEATHWAEQLEYGGYDDWRLWSAFNSDGSGPCRGSNCTDSELGYLFYVVGGLSHGQGILSSYYLNGVFANLKNSHYWSETYAPDAANPWVFHTLYGNQFNAGFTNDLYAWAVRDGDVTDQKTTGLITHTVTWEGQQVGLVYDEAQNLTWTKDANLPATETFGVSGIYAHGYMSSQTAQAWIAAMNKANYGGFNDWRLWKMTDPNAVCDRIDYIPSGPNCGSRVDPDSSEMASLWYNALGNKVYPDVGWVLRKHGPFDNTGHDYWSGTKYATDPAYTWYFTWVGSQLYYLPASVVNTAWAVRDGNVADQGTQRGYIDVASIPDDGFGNPMLAALLVLPDGTPQIIIKEIASKRVVKQINLSREDRVPLGVAGLFDLNGNGSPEVAVLFRMPDGGGVVQIRDAETAKWIRGIHFFGPNWEVKAITSLDENLDGISEISVLAVRKDGSSAAMKVKDSLTEAQVTWIELPGPAD